MRNLMLTTTALLLTTACAGTAPRDAATLDALDTPGAGSPPVYMTGSRLRAQVNPVTGEPLAGSAPVRVIGEEDIRSTGQPDIDRAVILLDPAIRRQD